MNVGPVSLVMTGLDSIYISLDGSTPSLNDKLRGIKGYFELAMKAIENLKSFRGNSRPKIFIAFTVNKANMFDLENVARFVKKQALDGLCFQPVLNLPKVLYKVDKNLMFDESDAQPLQTLVDRVVKLYPDILPLNREYYRQFSSFIDSNQSLSSPHNVAGFAFVSIDPWGNVYPDPNETEPMGNVRKESFRKIWYGHRADEVRDRIAQKKYPEIFYESFLPMNVALQKVTPLTAHRALKPIFHTAEHF